MKNKMVKITINKPSLIKSLIMIFIVVSIAIIAEVLKYKGFEQFAMWCYGFNAGTIIWPVFGVTKWEWDVPFIKGETNEKDN